MKLSEPKNKNYCAIVVKLEQPYDLTGCSNVRGVKIFGNQVIVGRDAAAGEIGLYFPVETALSKEFLAANNLYRKPEWGNANPEQKGYFEESGRVKAVKFRGHKSEGFYIPYQSLIDLGVAPGVDLKVGDEFDAFEDKSLYKDRPDYRMEICRKYVPRRKEMPTHPNHRDRSSSNRASVRERIVRNQFRFHPDTEQLRRNIHKILPTDVISITDKWHGSSCIVANVLVERQLRWYEKLLKRLGVLVQDAEYGYVWGSRRSIKGVIEPKENALHYYSSDVWAEVYHEVKEKVPPGYTLYGEVVGYTGSCQEIQKGYHYGCLPGHHRFLVYRVTQTNPTGNVLELSWPQVKAFCNERELEHVKELYYGPTTHFCPFDVQSLEEWQGTILRYFEALYASDKDCPHNKKTSVPAEGIVVRKDHLDRAEAYKLKNYRFLERESKQLDAGVTDLEVEEEIAAEAMEENV